MAPTDCIVLEDAGVGIAGARAAGVRHVIGVGLGSLEATPPDIQVPDLRGIRWLGYAFEIIPN